MKLSRRKFDTLTKFLRATIANESIKHAVRMQAAIRLDDLLARELHYAERAAARKERAELRVLAQQEQGGPIPAQQIASQLAETDRDKESEMNAVFDRVLRPKEKTDDGTDRAE